MEDHLRQLEGDERPLILVIDDDPAMVRFLDELLRTAGYRAISAFDGAMGINIAEKYRPNIIILDLQMPGLDGCAVCKELKSRPLTAEIPVVFVTAAERTDEIISRCFEAGASDFIGKPISRVDLLARLRVVLREQAIREAYHRIATEDQPTGLNNRRQFLRDLDAAIAESFRSSSETILILADIDGLAEVNDRLGHEFGDELILTFARLLLRQASSNCKAGRIGEDDFGMLLTNSTKERGLKLCERIRLTFASIVFDAAKDPKQFSAGFGLAAYGGDADDFDADQFMQQADTALYVAKQAGQNQVAAHWHLDPASLPNIPVQQRRSRSRTRQRTQQAFIGVPETETGTARAAEPESPAPAADHTSSAPSGD
jgi:diguanylate cyclase (GGDEF)-like protein